MAQRPPDSITSPSRHRLSDRPLAWWGTVVHRHARLVLAVTILVALASLPLVTSVNDRLSPGGWLPDGAESIRVDHLLDDEFGRHATAHYILFSDSDGSLRATDPEFRREVERTLAPLRGDPTVTAIHTWGSTTNPALRDLLIADDESASLAVVMLNQDVNEAAAGLPHLRDRLRSDLLDVQIGGWPATTADLRDLAASDLLRAELIAIPIALLVLVVVFGSVLVAGVPLVTTALALLPALAGVAVLARLIETSVFTINMVIMIGIAVGIDYALIMVSRYREELREHDPETALGRTMATAGRTVIVSGAAVAVGMLGLLALDVDAAVSAGLAASIVVASSVAMSLTALPATLTLLGKRVRRVPGEHNLARRLVPRRAAASARLHLDRHPVLALAGTCALLLALALPIVRMDAQPPTMQVLPQSQPARQMFDEVRARFPASSLSPVVLIAAPVRGDMTSARNLEDLAEFTATLSEIDGVTGVVSVWSFVPPGIGTNWLRTGILVDEDIATAVRPYLTSRAAVIELNVAGEASSGTAHAVLETVRETGAQLSGYRFHVMTGGETATSVDLTGHMAQRAPWAIGLVIAAMAAILLLQFRSVVLPVKAILLNLLSLTASFGALVWVFQDGNLTGLLGFEPLGHTIVIVPLVMFCFIFGLGMDYEVIMLSRIREAWLETGDNRHAIATGLRQSAGIVTSAATVMFVVFVAFGASDLQIIQQLGLGLALAVLVEATLIRLVALPAAMQLMGRWNWWAPSFVRRDPVPVSPAIEPATRSR